MQIRKSAVGQSPQIIERQRCPLVSPEQQIWIGCSILLRETGSIDEIASITRQRHSVSHFLSSRTRFRILSGNSTDAHHRLLCRIDQDEAHLKQDFESCCNWGGIALFKTFGAVAALKYEHLAASRPRQLGFEHIDLPRCYQRRQTRYSLNHFVEARRIVVDCLLVSGFALPGIWKPVIHHFRMMEVQGLFKTAFQIGPSVMKPTCGWKNGNRAIPTLLMSVFLKGAE